MEYLQLLKNEQICYVCCGIKFMPCGKEKQKIDRQTDSIFCLKQKKALSYIYIGMKKNVERFSQNYYFRGIYRIITLLCLTYNKGYLIEILSVSVLKEVLQVKIKNSNVNTSPSRQHCLRPITSGVSLFFSFQSGAFIAPVPPLYIVGEELGCR